MEVFREMTHIQKSIFQSVSMECMIGTEEIRAILYSTECFEIGKVINILPIFVKKISSRI